ncbi:hypothetical protein [Rhodopirellula sallentina]|nr:hypothetical protein [Rhodopirellula sallentina]
MVPVLDTDTSEDEVEVPSRDVESTINPSVIQMRIHEWMRKYPGRPFRMLDLADPGSIQTSDLAQYALPGKHMVLRHHSFTIGGLPFVHVVVDSGDQVAATPSELPKAPGFGPFVGDPTVGHLYGPAQKAYLRALQQANQAQAMAQGFAKGIPADGFGSGVGVSVTTGPDGSSKVVESYFGQAATKEGVANRSYTLPADGRGHSVGVEATTDGSGNPRVKRYSNSIR